MGPMAFLLLFSEFLLTGLLSRMHFMEALYCILTAKLNPCLPGLWTWPLLAEAGRKSQAVTLASCLNGRKKA